MNAAKWLKAGAAVCAMVFVPAVGSAAQSAAGRADHLMDHMRYDAQRVEYHAQLMQNFADHTSFTWNTEGHQLRRVKADINDMGRRLSRLERIENSLPASQQVAVQRLAPVVQTMADNADAAINFRNAHHNGFWAPSFMNNAKNLDREANIVSRTIHQGEEGQLGG